MRRAVWALGVLIALSLPGCEPELRDPFATPPERALAPGEVARVYAALESGEADLAPALDLVVERGDYRFVGVLIEALRASQVGLLDGRHYNAKVVALERLAGQRFGADWVGWLRWYEATSLRTPPDFAAFKSRIFRTADPLLAELLGTTEAGAGRSEEIVWSGAPPAPIGPEPVVAHEDGSAARLDGAEPIVGVALGGEARAYPLRWLDWYEVANDRLGGRDIAVVWCGFCASARAFERAAPGAGTRHFASSGLLQRSVRLLYDAETRTLWNELTGAPALAPRARLDPLPALLTTWRAWRERNPGSTILAEGSDPAVASRGAPYARYHAGEEPIFPVALSRNELAAKELAYGIEAESRAKAFALRALLEARVVNAAVGDQPIVLVATRGPIELEASDGTRTIAFSPGAEVRAYARGTDTFRIGPDPDRLVDAAGSVWRATDTALESAGGASYRRLPGTLSYWFAWQAFYPETEVGDAGERSD